MSLLACSQELKRHRMRKLTERSKQESDIQITAGTDHCAVAKPSIRNSILIEGLKKNKALQMSERQRVPHNLYPTRSASSGTCIIQIPPTAKEPAAAL